jgi:hypothetical protein
MTKPEVSRGRVNAAVVHRKRMFLFGESWAQGEVDLRRREPGGSAG